MEPKVTTFDFGVSKGTPCVEATLTPEDDPAELIAKIEALKFPQRDTLVYLHVDTDVPGGRAADLAKSLKDLGYPLIALTSGDTYPMWLNYVTWLIVVRSKPRWLRFRCAEFVWLPEKLGAPPDLPANGKSCVMWVKGEGAFEWATKQSANWRVM